MLVEREEHLGRLGQITKAAEAGKGRVVLLEGPSAAGKTELLHVFADRAEAAGFRLLHAICSRSEENLAFGVLNQLLRYAGLPAGAADVAHPGPGQAARSVDELCAALLERAADAPLLIAVDDSQYADSDSLHVLLHLSRRLRSARVVVVLVDNCDFPSANLPLRAELLRQSNLSRIQVSPLTEAGVGEFLALRMDAESARRLAPDFHASTGGSPLLLGALADDHAVAGGSRSARGYSLALLSCLHRGDQAMLAVARAVAVLDEDATEDGAGVLSGVDVRAVARAMVSAGLLAEDGGFRHPEARQAVLEDLSPREHSSLYGRAARLLHNSGAEPIRVARHLREAGRADGPWAVRTLVEAAECELLADRPEDAAACLALAERSSGDLTERAEVLSRLAHTGFQFDPGTASRHLAPLITASRAGHLKFRESALLVRQLLWNGRADEASSVLERMREGPAEPATAPDSEMADLEQWLAWAHPPLARPVSAAVGSLGRRPGGTGEGAGTIVALRSEPWLGRAATLADHLARDRPGAAERAEQVLWDLRLSRTACWTGESAMLSLLTLLHSDRADLAAEWCERLAADAAEHSAPTWQAVFTAVRAEVAVRQGDLVSAVERAREALALLPAKSWGVAIGMPLATLIVATTRMGQYEEAARWLSHGVPAAMYESWYGLPFLQARGIHHLATNHVHAALGDFLSCGELQRTWGMDSPGPVPWRAGAAEACLRLGNPDRAKQLVHEQLARPTGGSSRTRGVSLRLYAATCAPGRALQLLTEALELLESAGDRFEQARVLADMSRMYYALGEHRRARMMFRQSLHVAKACEALPLAQELLSGSCSGSGEQERPRITAAPDPAPGHSELTGSERRVASLAVMGYTNREIASKLYVTPSTVEQHLTRVYRKLNIQRRQDLPSDLWPNVSRAG